jgi:hypothetical protein
MEINATEYTYLMDSNYFITPRKVYYKFSVVPTFWKILNENAEKKKIVSIRHVRNELCPKSEITEKDELQMWIENEFKCEFINTYDDINIIENYREIMQYLESNPEKYSKLAINKWARNKTADGWIIATAMANKNLIIVSFESEKNPKNNPKIKIVAKDFGLDCIDLFTMMESLKFTI